MAEEKKETEEKKAEGESSQDSESCTCKCHGRKGCGCMLFIIGLLLGLLIAGISLVIFEAGRCSGGMPRHAMGMRAAPCPHMGMTVPLSGK